MLPPSARQRLFSTSTRARATLPTNFHTYRAAAPTIAAAANNAPKLGRIAKWYLPTMAAIAVGMLFIPEDFFDEPSKRTVTLGAANPRISLGIAHELDAHNRRANQQFQATQEERNWAMLNAFGGRNGLEDMEKVIQGYEVGHKMPAGRHERNLRLEEAYGRRDSLHDVRRAMELYEVQ